MAVKAAVLESAESRSWVKLPPVQRLLPLLVAVALATAGGARSALHVHRDTDHRHAGHHHSPASHQHEHDRVPGDARARLVPCGPAAHAVSVQSTVKARLGAPFIVHQIGLVERYQAPAARLTPVSRRPIDLREHGPPPNPSLAARPPPASPTA
jgi:hypothetical protein